MTRLLPHHMPHAPYLRAVVEALGAEAGTTYLDDSLAGCDGSEEVMLLEMFVGFSYLTLVWDQVSGWQYAHEDLEGVLLDRRPLITGALVPLPETVARAALALGSTRSWTLPLAGSETPLAGGCLPPELEEVVKRGDLAPDVARRLAVYTNAVR